MKRRCIRIGSWGMPFSLIVLGLAWFALVGCQDASVTVETGTETDYLAVFMEGKKVGHSVHTRSVEGGQVTTSEQVSITISRIGIPITIEMTETSVETTAGKPLRFESVQNLGAMVMKVEGVVKDDGVVDVNSSSMGTQQKSTMQWPKAR